MNRTGRVLAAALPLAGLAVLLSLTVAACGGGGPAPDDPPPASAHTAAERAAVQNWLAKTNAMWTSNDFAALDEITTAAMRTIYLAEKRQASQPSNASRQAFQLTGLSITIPCQAGRPAVFVAYADTDVFDLGPDMRPVAMVPAVVHHETDTFITTYTAIDPPRSAGAALVLDGFFGWPLRAVAG